MSSKINLNLKSTPRVVDWWRCGDTATSRAIGRLAAVLEEKAHGPFSVHVPYNGAIIICSPGVCHARHFIVSFFSFSSFSRHPRGVSIVVHFRFRGATTTTDRPVMSSNAELCFRCNRSGHIARACREKSSVPVRNNNRSGKTVSANDGKRDLICYKCNSSGHLARECKKANRCFKCNAVDHMARECTVVSVKVPKCFNCLKLGHVINDCPKERSSRYVASSNGNISSSVCYSCNKIGHFMRDCQMAKDDDHCSKCNNSGHVARQCPNVKCYICDKVGHLGHQCDKRNKLTRNGVTHLRRSHT